MTKPVAFSPEIAALVCDRIADGLSLREACRDEGMPDRDSVRRWRRDNPDFDAQYARALIDRTDAQLEEILDIADDATNDYVDRRRQDGRTERVLDEEHIQRSKLRIHARQWAMARMQPRKYGDKIAVGGDEDAPPIQVRSDMETARAVAFLLEKTKHELDRSD